MPADSETELKGRGGVSVCVWRHTNRES